MIVALTVGGDEHGRSAPGHFVVAPGHASADAEHVDGGPVFEIVDERGEAGRIAEERT